VASYDTRPGNEMRLFYNAPKPTQTRDSRDYNQLVQPVCPADEPRTPGV